MSRKIIGAGIIVLLCLTVIIRLLSKVYQQEQPGRETQVTKPEYGEPLPWEEVQALFPRYAAAVVEDMETGKRFEVTRRGGIYHADVQPLTIQDTRTMQEIYAGGWSWKRRAVIVEIGSVRLAASMNGMPHGSGRIRENDFQGHFCLHFLQCKVHASKKVDPAHQMMVWKAAGQPLRPYLEAGPREVLELVFTALNQGDGGLALLGVEPENNEDLWLAAYSLLGQLPEIEIKRISVDEDLEQQIAYQLQINILYPGEKAKVNKDGVLILRQDPVTQRWLIAGSGLRALLAKPETPAS